MPTEQTEEAAIVLARRIGELEAEAAQLTADLAAAHHALAARDAMIVELRKGLRRQALELVADYDLGAPI